MGRARVAIRSLSPSLSSPLFLPMKATKPGAIFASKIVPDSAPQPYSCLSLAYSLFLPLLPCLSLSPFIFLSLFEPPLI